MKNIIKTAGENTVEAEVAVYLIKQVDYYVSFCPALDLSSFGDTEKEARKGFETAVAIFLKETRKRITALTAAVFSTSAV